MLAVLVLGCLTASANPVSLQEAQRTAQEFLSQGLMRKLKGSRRIDLAFTLDRDAVNIGVAVPVVYVFGLEGSDGFVVVSGDDVARKVLGYAIQGAADFDKMPRNMQAWLNSYADEIAWARAHGCQASAKLPAEDSGERADVPFLLPSYWAQDKPYNNDCLFDEEYSLTGCVATTMAQIMYYWATVGVDGKLYRPGAKAMSPYVSTDKQYQVPALPALQEFDWDNMIPGRYYTEWQIWPWSEENEAAVAQLMRYCGQSVRMNYTPEGSGAFPAVTAPALRHYFGFDKGTRRVMRDTMSADQWASVIYAELAAGRPVSIAGFDETGGGGHQFVCDGYEASSGMFHINWGWSGYSDSYFELEALSVEMNGSGETKTYSFNSQREAVIGIQPPTGDDGGVVAESATFVASVDKGSQPASRIGEDEVSKNGVTISVWPEGSFGNGLQYRVYSGSTFSVAAASGFITKVVVTCTASGGNKYGPGCFGVPSEGTFTYEGKTGTWEGKSREFFMTAESAHVRMTKVDVTVEPEPYLRGDANGDGLINMSDVTAVINYVLGRLPAPFVFANADTDGDGYINMTDVTNIISIILSPSSGG